MVDLEAVTATRCTWKMHEATIAATKKETDVFDV